MFPPYIGVAMNACCFTGEQLFVLSSRHPFGHAPGEHGPRQASTPWERCTYIYKVKYTYVPVERGFTSPIDSKHLPCCSGSESFEIEPKFQVIYLCGTACVCHTALLYPLDRKFCLTDESAIPIASLMFTLAAVSIPEIVRMSP